MVRNLIRAMVLNDTRGAESSRLRQEAAERKRIKLIKNRIARLETRLSFAKRPEVIARFQRKIEHAKRKLAGVFINH